MCEIISDIRRVKSSALMPAIGEIIAGGGRVRLTVTGSSMYPFLRQGVDSVILAAVEPTALKRGSIVLVMRDNGQYVLHRVIKHKRQCFYLNGDAQQQIEGPLLLEQVIAVVTSVWRRDRHIDCRGLWWRALSALWGLALPVRGYILSFYRWLR
ncbi:MAG: hypothetical protein VR67_18895 [Peptococcaceae bacterium BRH_c8a]|nr:MAG: hypothetical protein VR67_18895 [Peptococcaceae bacterium BRH_c8a]